MVRFEDALSALRGPQLNMPALCAAIGVPERTLRVCCAEFLGMSPARYLLLLRLNMVRSALRRAHPSTAVSQRLPEPIDSWSLDASPRPTAPSSGKCRRPRCGAR